MGITGFGVKPLNKLKDVKRDKTGGVVMETAATGLTTSVTAAGTGQTTTSITGNRNNVSMNYNITGTGGTIQLLQNGSVMASATGLATGASGTLSFYTTTPPTSPTLTGLASFNGAGTATFTFNINGVRNKAFDDFMNDIRRVGRTVQFISQATGLTTTATTSGVSVTTKTTGITGSRFFVQMPWENQKGVGLNLTLMKNGSALVSATNQAQGASGTLVASFDAPTSNFDLTGNYSWNTAGTTDSFTATGSTAALGTSASVTPDVGTLTGTAYTVYYTVHVYTGSGEFKIYMNGTTVISDTGLPRDVTRRYTATGTWTSPTWSLWLHGTNDRIGVDTRTLRLGGPGRVSVSFSVNQVEKLALA